MITRVAPPAVLVKRQQRKRFWEYKLIKPDIIIDKGDAVVVIDTKWKVLREAKPSDADLKQMYVYHNYWDAGQTLLLYPNVFDLKFKTGTFRIPEAKFRCQMGFVDIVDSYGKLNFGVGEDILGMIRRDSDTSKF